MTPSETSSRSPKAEAAELVKAATFFWSHNPLKAMRMAKQAATLNRSPERTRLLLAELDLIADADNGR